MPTPVKAANKVTSPPIRASFQGGRMADSSRGWTGGNACHPYTNLCICQDELLTAREGVLQGLPEAPESKLEAGSLRFRRQCVPAVEQQLRLATEDQPQRERRCRNDRRAMQHVSDFPGQLPLGADIRRYCIHRPRQPSILEGQPIQPDQVVDVDPCKPLPAVTQRPAGEEPERQDQEPEGGRSPSEDHGRTDPDHPHSERLGLRSGSFPLLAKASQKRITR